jgi:glycosyltransferase involved in cell wall biosynthesis
LNEPPALSASVVKLVLLSRRYAPLVGGAEKVLSYLAPALAEEGHEVTVLTSSLDVETLPAHEVVPVARGSLRVVRLKTSRIRFVGTLLHIRGITRELRRLQPDLAYVSMLKHDAFAALGSGHDEGFPVVLRPEGAGETGDVAWLARARFGRTLARRCRGASAFVSIAKAVEQELRDAWTSGPLRSDDPNRPGTEPPIVPIPNGVPVPNPPYARRADWRQAPTAVFVGRLAVEKSIGTLLDAWPLVRAEFPGARLVLVGDGPERAGLEAHAARLGLTTADVVRFAGALADPSAALREADLFVLPSREEGMSIALLEAMALGLPVVVSSIPGNRKLVADFKHGRLFPVSDPAALARAVVDQWSEFDRALHMARAARSLVQHKYSIRAMAQAHLELFDRLVTAARPRRRRVGHDLRSS